MATLIQLPDCAKKVLEALYPTVDWTRVHFFSGKPWYILPGYGAITLPEPFSLSKFRIYLGSATDFCDKFDQGGQLKPNVALNTIVHEGFHILQFTHIAGGLGVGIARPCYLRYIQCHLASGGYDNNPFEIQASDQDDRFDAAHHTPICDCSSGSPVFNQTGLDELLNYKDPKTGVGLVFRSVRPPWCMKWWSIFTWLLTLILVSILLVIWFLAHLFDRVNCTLLAQMKQECKTQAQTTITQCAQWGTQTRDECTNWATQTRDECSTWATQTRDECSSWGTNAYQKCCDWAPCSWLCKALVWVIETVCVAWTHIVEQVCIAWTQIVEAVCTVWTQIVEAICTAYATIAMWICIAWVTVLRWVLFCWV